MKKNLAARYLFFSCYSYILFIYAFIGQVLLIGILYVLYPSISVTSSGLHDGQAISMISSKNECFVS